MVSERPIFVVGCPRTGTTLMKDVLNGHSDVHLFNEVHFFERIWDQRDRFGDLSRPEQLASAVEALRRVVTAHGTDSEVAGALPSEELRKAVEGREDGYAALLRTLLETAARLQGARRWGDSSPQDVLYLDTIVSWFPEARIVGMVRDPRAFLASYKNYHRRATSSYRERFNPLSNSLVWRSYMSALLAAARGPLASSMHVTHYEALTSEPEAEIRKVCDHLEIDFEPEMLEVPGSNSSYARGRGARGIHRDSVERWREELTPTEIWLVERVAGGPMTALGYAPIASAQGLRPRARELAGILGLAPARLYNMLFRGKKPFTWRRLQRVLGLLRGA